MRVKFKLKGMVEVYLYAEGQGRPMKDAKAFAPIEIAIEDLANAHGLKVSSININIGDDDGQY